ncbi:MAG: hypothetical protein GF317_09075 [Candidatus Lokiarchaeota archaeon]|nr:hypothetical protein [Candidatus Lokiarchaeota archaeon]MBD3199864.1 hypothetical protein [Candidatus Lokiarchaeota archaeon]
MQNISHLKVGDKLEHIFNGLNHQKLKLYAKVGADPNPIHYNDSIAKREGLKEMNSQYLYPTGFIMKIFEKFFRYTNSFQILELGIHPQELKSYHNHLFYNSYWRCHDTLYSVAKLTKTNGVRLYFDIDQYIITPIEKRAKDESLIKEFKSKKNDNKSDVEKLEDLNILELKGRKVLIYLKKQLLEGYIIVKIKK